MSNFDSEGQRLDPSALISLFQLDCTSIDGAVLYFVQAGTIGQDPTQISEIVYDGITYTSIDIVFEGMETSGVGAFPTPTISISNTDGVIQAIANTYGDLNGCTLKRIRTYARFLDGEVDADPGAFYGPDVFNIERKVEDTPTVIRWELSTAIDQEGVKLPNRPMVRSTCMWRYRIWNEGAAAFDYTKAECPYTGTDYYDAQDNPVANAKDDRPSRTLNCCRLRFGEGNAWPFGGFPGMGRRGF